jgi:hypothetical protein
MAPPSRHPRSRRSDSSGGGHDDHVAEPARTGAGGAPLCTGGVETPANAVHAIEAMRESSTRLAHMLTTSVPEAQLAEMRDQIDTLVGAQAENGPLFVQAGVIAEWGGSLRWTIRGELSRTRRCAEAPTRRTGTTRVGGEHGRTATGAAGRTDESEGTTGDHGVTGTVGRSGSRTIGGTRSGSTSVEATGAVDMFEEQWDYSVDWTITVEHDPDSFNPMNFLPRIIASLSDYGGPWSESGSSDIGTISAMNADGTPPPRTGGSRRRESARTPEPTVPHRMSSSDPDPTAGPRRVAGP